MIYCEQCRVKKHWPDSLLALHEKCQVCQKTTKCYDTPAVMLIPELERTVEQKQMCGLMMQQFREKAEAMILTHADGRQDYTATEAMRKSFITRNGEVDWYQTILLRLKIQEHHQESERTRRDKRNREL